MDNQKLATHWRKRWANRLVFAEFMKDLVMSDEGRKRERWFFGWMVNLAKAAVTISEYLRHGAAIESEFVFGLKYGEIKRFRVEMTRRQAMYGKVWRAALAQYEAGADCTNWRKLYAAIRQELGQQVH